MEAPTTQTGWWDSLLLYLNIGKPKVQRYDSDTILITDNPVLLAAAKKNYDKFLVPTSCVESTKTKRCYSPEEQCDLDYKTSSNKIGEIVNLSQVLNSLFWDRYNTGVQIEELMPIYYDVCQLSVMSGIEIDFI